MKLHCLITAEKANIPDGNEDCDGKWNGLVPLTIINLFDWFYLIRPPDTLLLLW
jgi:hypothetical protein